MRNEPLTMRGDTHAYDRQQPLPQKVPTLKRAGRQEVGRGTKISIQEYFLPTDKCSVAFLSSVTILPIALTWGEQRRRHPPQSAMLQGSG